MSVCQSPVRAHLLSDTILINCRRLPAPAVPLPCPRPAKCGAGTRMVPGAVSTHSPPAASFQPAFLSPFPFFSGCSKTLCFSLAHEPRGRGQRFVTLPSAFSHLSPQPQCGSGDRAGRSHPLALSRGSALPVQYRGHGIVLVPGEPMARAEQRTGSCPGAAAMDRTGLPLPGSQRQKRKDWELNN